MSKGYMVRYFEHLARMRRLSLADSMSVAVKASECVSSIITLGVVARIAGDRLAELTNTAGKDDR